MSGALHELAATFGIEFETKELEQGVDSVHAAVGAVQSFAGAIAGAGIVLGIRQFVDGLNETGSALNDASDRLGVTTDDLQELQFAFGQAGVRGEQVNNALAGLSVRMEQARAGTGPAAAAFHDLGLRVRDASGHMLPVSDMLPDIAREMGRIHDPAQRVRIAMQLFGGVGRRLVGTLHEGAGGIEELRGQFHELGGGMSGEAVSAADDYGDALGKLDVAVLSLKSRVGLFLLPALKEVVEWVAKAGAALGRLVQGTHVVQVGVIALSSALAAAALPVIAAWAPALAPFVALAAGVAVVVLLVDDLWTAMEGGQSAIGTLVDAQFGMNSMRDAVAGAQLVWLDLQQTISETLDDLVFFSARAQSIIPHVTEEGRREAAQIENENRRRTAGAASRRTAYEAERARLIGGSGPTVEQATERARLLGADRRATAAAFTGRGSAAQTADHAAGNKLEVHHHHNGATTIAVHSATGNPTEIARRVVAALDARDASRNDAAHPQEPRD